ncbi:MAG: ABC transporter permease, partial [Planctomycetaceae bacterium]|nr:ABC transporter permease [Planctomycetaceae bacterium]
MSFAFLFRSLWYDRWINTAVVLGVICAVAVLTGALLVGDSMRGSLKALTLDRLGNIDTILFAPQFIDWQRAGDYVAASEGVILLPAAVEFNGKVSGIQLLGRNPHPHPLPEGEGTKTFANQALADKIGLRAGERISLRLMPPQSIPPESSLGRKDQLLRTLITVDEIIPNKGIGRFSLKMDQQAEPLLIVPLSDMQRLLKVDDKVNAIFYFNDSPHPLLAAQRAEIENSFNPTLEDLGIVAELHGGNWYIKSARMLFNDEQVEAIKNALSDRHSREGGNPDDRVYSLDPRLRGGDGIGLLYLATSIRANDRETPYSTIYACDERKLKNDEIALNQWTADDLGVTIGDDIELTWFEPDDVSVTHSKTFNLVQILPMEGLGCDPHVVPTVQGFTDEVSIADWDPPFPFDAKKIRKKDEEYWDKYHAAPKVFLSLETGQELFGSRFGNVTTFVSKNHSRHPRESGGLEEIADHLDSRLRGNDGGFSLFGINFVPVKEQGLAASSGTTPFSVLFLSFSFFIIASALMLVMMLFRLSVEMKAKRIGILLAVGWTHRQVALSLIAEGFLLSLIGSLFGAILGIGYAAVMIYGLTTWWGDAIGISVGCQSDTVVPFLTLFINPASLLIGFASGVVLSVLTIFWSVRGVTKVPLRSLLHGNLAGTPRLLTNNHSLRGRTTIKSPLTFAQSNMARNPSRSLLCIGLIASTTFLVLSISAFHLEPPDGAGFIAETAFPVYADVTTPEGRNQLGIQPDDEKYLAETADTSAWYAFRMKDGDSTSCLNLYQTSNPRILGAPKGGGDKISAPEIFKPIVIDPDGIPLVPVLLDQNTAMYALHLSGRVGEVFELPQHENFRCEIVHLVQNSTYQGEIVMGEENLLHLFPEVNGYQYFLFSEVDDRTLQIVHDLLGDYGFQGE